MQNLSQRLARLVIMVGWPGGIGIAMLGAALVLTISLLLPAHRENASLHNEIERMESKSKLTSPSLSTTDVRHQLDTFAETLPQADEINALLSLLHELAAKNHVVLKNSEYRTPQNNTGGINQIRILVKTEGSYTDVRSLLRELPRKLPALAIAHLSMTRQNISEIQLHADIEFTLYYSQSNAQR